MAWWVWLLMVWPAVALGVGLILGRVIAHADREERRRADPWQVDRDRNSDGSAG